MNTFILMIILNLGYGQKEVTFQEFTSIENCKTAIEEIKKSENIERLICMKK